VVSSSVAQEKLHAAPEVDLHPRGTLMSALDFPAAALMKRWLITIASSSSWSAAACVQLGTPRG
jgi:hypothetical protein